MNDLCTVVGKLHNSTLSVSSCYDDTTNQFTQDKAALGVMAGFVIFLIPILVGTVYDILRPQNVEQNNNNVADVLAPHRPRGPTVSSVASLCSSESGQTLRPSKYRLLVTILMSFSLKSNAEKILSTDDSNSQIKTLHGLRVLMMLWIIGGHSYSFAMQWLFFQNPQSMAQAPQSLFSQVIANGTFSVDSFFFMSGLLVTIIGLRALRRSRGKFDFVVYYVHRYLRMTPMMMALIAFSATLLRYMGSGPAWFESIQMYDGWCKKNWWVNALYLHNFIRRENMVSSRIFH